MRLLVSHYLRVERKTRAGTGRPALALELAGSESDTEKGWALARKK